MTTTPTVAIDFANIPSVERLLSSAAVQPLIRTHGRELVTAVARDTTTELRRRDLAPPTVELDLVNWLGEQVRERVETLLSPSLRPVFNLTGTVLHTNLGRAPMPQEAIDAMVAVAGQPSNLEFSLASGKRGDRDSHVEDWICRLTGAQAATVVNNNAAAVMLVLNTLAADREVPVSRGELVEIGGSFRVPDVMSRAHCTLIEVGTTNRTHPHDYANAVGEKTALLMKVHTSNYVVQGFTKEVDEKNLAKIAHDHGIPYVYDLGSGTLTDLAKFGLPHETTPAQALECGADIVTFSGDKLLGGPQCGIIVGQRDLVSQIKSNPMKRALRLDKITLAALEAILKLYSNPATLVERLPALRLLTRSQAAIREVSEKVLPTLSAQLAAVATVTTVDCSSQIGSGALPVDTLPSVAIEIRPVGEKRGLGKQLNALSRGFRELPVPVIGRIRDNAFQLDLRCLEDESMFLSQLHALEVR